MVCSPFRSGHGIRGDVVVWNLVGNSGGGVPVGVADGHQLAGLTVGMVKRDLPAARGAGAGGYDDLPPWGDVPGDGVPLDLCADGGDPGGLRGGKLAGVADVQV